MDLCTQALSENVGADGIATDGVCLRNSSEEEEKEKKQCRYKLVLSLK